MGEVEKWIALTLVPNLGPRRIAAVFQERGSIDGFFDPDPVPVAEILNLKPGVIGSMGRAIDLERGTAILRQCQQKGIKVTCPGLDDYPPLLLECHDPPPVLYYRGRLPKRDLLAVVGSRKATGYGRRTAAKLIPALCRRSLGIVSGLALGIDSYAHRACLEAGGYTLAVLGNGVDQYYPYDNRRLQADILARGGCLLSEFAPGAKPRPHHFPQRNRIISGLCRGVVIIEAGKKSGAMITVGFALEQGRDVFAVPGNIDSAQSEGTNHLIRLGAKPVLTAVDILEEYNLDLPLLSQPSQALALDKAEAAILTLLDEQGVSLDELCYQLKAASSTVLSKLIALELKGLVERLPGQKYIRSIGVQSK